ncbi:MAG: penicillin-binding protein 1C [Chloroflexota bacterium]
MRRFATRRRLFALLLAALALLGIAYFALAADLPSPDALMTRASPDATKIYDRNGRLLYEVLDPRAGRRTRVALAELPTHFRQAVLAVEDANFYQHPGVDAVGVARALWQAASEERVVSGGSTITQQLARALLLSDEERDSRSLTRKLREMILALRLTQAYEKNTILEMYLNEVYFGQLAYGAEAAARAYFGKPTRELDLAESALLAGLIQSPAAYNPLVHLDAARERQRVVLGLMVKDGFVSEGEAELARGEELHFASATMGAELNSAPNLAQMRAPHFVVYVRNLLEAEYGAEMVNRGGLRVVTTLDLDLQERAEEIIRNRLAELARRTREGSAPDYNAHDAALVAIEPTTGEILAMVGSANYDDASIDGAVNVALANRQPGSAIKPLTYAAAFAQGFTPATVIADVPTTFTTKEGEPYAPQNYDRTWHGPISLRQALATSSNMVAVKVLDRVGLDALIATAKSLGITTFDDNERFGLSLTLGGGEVQLLELTAAYAAFANEGRRVVPQAILTVNSEQSTVNSARVTTDCSPLTVHCSLVTPQVAYLITHILSDDAARIPAFGEDSVLKLSHPAAAKTGTTTDFRDNWTIGYTPDLAVGVWVGNANNAPMVKVSGITGAGPIWHDFMEAALAGRPARNFARPDGLVAVEICETSGLLATDVCPRRRTEIFSAGTEPLRPDDSYRVFALDTATGLLWLDGCNGQRVEKVLRVLPPDAEQWGRENGIEQPPMRDCKAQRPTSNVQRPTSIIITNPAPNSAFALTSHLPPDAQRVEVSARLGATIPMREVTLLVDSHPIATFAAPPYRALWQLAAGEHMAQAVGVDGEGRRVESAVVRFRVE